MKLGDIVTVRASGRRARIVEAYGAGFYEVENLPYLVPVPRQVDGVESAPGIYHARELEPVQEQP
jgi:hypothetical protein